MKQKCFLCGKEKEFWSYFKLYYSPYGDLMYEESIPICRECREKPINEIYKKVMELRVKEIKKSLDVFE